MLRANRNALSVELAGELRDALRRRQKELPARWLAAVDAASLGNGVPALPAHPHEETERELALALLRRTLPDARPRGVVAVTPSASGACFALAEALGQRGSVTAIAAAELDPTLATEMLERIAARVSCPVSSAIACDCTVELPLPDEFPRPRVYVCLGNVLGNSTAVGAVRLLRVLRTTMGPTDSIVLGLEASVAKPAPSLSDDEYETAASRHLGTLELINATIGTAFDVSRFDYRRTFDSENGRFETHLVARRALEVEVPGGSEVRFKKGESIRTSVSSRFDRNRVSAMMGGVGLALREWTTDPEARYVVALATPAV